MAWVRLDDDFLGDPVIANLSDSALVLWIAGIAYSNRKLTDGFIPHGVGITLRYCDGNPTPYIRELEAVGRWVPVEGGWKIHRYLDWQPSKEAVLEDREHLSSIRREAGRRGAQARWNGKMANAKQTDGPNPNPNPKYFSNFYAAYPRHVGRRAAERAFAAALKRAPAGTIIAGAKRLADDPNLPEPTFIPYPATWLNRDGWEDEPLPARDVKPGDAEREAERQRRIAEANRMIEEERRAEEPS